MLSPNNYDSNNDNGVLSPSNYDSNNENSETDPVIPDNVKRNPPRERKQPKYLTEYVKTVRDTEQVNLIFIR